MQQQVVSIGVWQSAQPIAEKSWRPRPIEAVPPGVSTDGCGGARNVMKKANFWMPLSTSGAPAPSRFVTSFGIVTSGQDAASSRSVWKSSLVMPCSTLYASPAKRSSDLFCAFQPKRAMVPSLPL